MANSRRLNVTLDPVRAAKLARISERTHIQEGTLARSLLSTAIDEADPDPAQITDLLNGIPGALEEAKLGLERGRAGDVIALDQL
jgi:hypothetical protein